jgi:type VI secretion system protein ImpK
MSALVVKEGGRLADAFSDLFILAMHVRQAHDAGNADALRVRMRQLFDDAQRKGQALGKSDEVLQQARYAVAAYVDEMVLTSPWTQKDQWSARPLQYEFFNEHVAGVEFFNRLETIRRNRGDVELVAVYHLCLILGFEGQYRWRGVEKLKALIDELSREVQTKQAGAVALSPRGKRPDELIEVVKRGLPSWVVVVASVAVLFFFYLALSFLIRHDVGNVIADLDALARGGL